MPDGNLLINEIVAFIFDLDEINIKCKHIDKQVVTNYPGLSSNCGY